MDKSQQQEIYEEALLDLNKLDGFNMLKNNVHRLFLHAKFHSEEAALYKNKVETVINAINEAHEVKNSSLAKIIKRYLEDNEQEE